MSLDLHVHSGMITTTYDFRKYVSHHLKKSVAMIFSVEFQVLNLNAAPTRIVVWSQDYSGLTKFHQQ